MSFPHPQEYPNYYPNMYNNSNNYWNNQNCYANRGKFKLFGSRRGAPPAPPNFNRPFNPNRVNNFMWHKRYISRRQREEDDVFLPNYEEYPSYRRGNFNPRRGSRGSIYPRHSNWSRRPFPTDNNITPQHQNQKNPVNHSEDDIIKLQNIEAKEVRNLQEVVDASKTSEIPILESQPENSHFKGFEQTDCSIKESNLKSEETCIKMSKPTLKCKNTDTTSKETEIQATEISVDTKFAKKFKPENINILKKIKPQDVDDKQSFKIPLVTKSVDESSIKVSIPLTKKNEFGKIKLMSPRNLSTVTSTEKNASSNKLKRTSQEAFGPKTLNSVAPTTVAPNSPAESLINRKPSFTTIFQMKDLAKSSDKLKANKTQKKEPKNKSKSTPVKKSTPPKLKSENKIPKDLKKLVKNLEHDKSINKTPPSLKSKSKKTLNENSARILYTSKNKLAHTSVSKSDDSDEPLSKISKISPSAKKSKINLEKRKKSPKKIKETDDNKNEKTKEKRSSLKILSIDKVSKKKRKLMCEDEVSNENSYCSNNIDPVEIKQPYVRIINLYTKDTRNQNSSIQNPEINKEPRDSVEIALRELLNDNPNTTNNKIAADATTDNIVEEETRFDSVEKDILIDDVQRNDIVRDTMIDNVFKTNITKPLYRKDITIDTIIQTNIIEKQVELDFVTEEIIEQVQNGIATNQVQRNVETNTIENIDRNFEAIPVEGLDKNIGTNPVVASIEINPVFANIERSIETSLGGNFETGVDTNPIIENDTDFDVIVRVNNVARINEPVNYDEAISSKDLKRELIQNTVPGTSDSNNFVNLSIEEQTSTASKTFESKPNLKTEVKDEHQIDDDVILVEEFKLTSSEIAKKFSSNIQYVWWILKEQKKGSLKPGVFEICETNIAESIKDFQLKLIRFNVKDFNINNIIMIWKDIIQVSYDEIIVLLDVITERFNKSKSPEVQKFIEFYESFKKLYATLGTNTNDKRTSPVLEVPQKEKSAQNRSPKRKNAQVAPQHQTKNPTYQQATAPMQYHMSERSHTLQQYNTCGHPSRQENQLNQFSSQSQVNNVNITPTVPFHPQQPNYIGQGTSMSSVRPYPIHASTITQLNQGIVQNYYAQQSSELRPQLQSPGSYLKKTVSVQPVRVQTIAHGDPRIIIQNQRSQMLYETQRTPLPPNIQNPPTLSNFEVPGNIISNNIQISEIPVRTSSVDSGITSPKQFQDDSKTSNNYFCNKCGMAADLQCCCGRAIYCSEDCQKRDWNRHYKDHTKKGK